MLAAAGNCVGVVVWPARYDQVIAVAGTNAADRPWKGSSRGADVDVSAPAELVWRARREGGDETFDRVTPGQGTSFAVALTAGVAALWLAHHGRDTIIATARARGTTVQELFRSALRETARVPANWDRESMGAGIVDARALLELPLDRIPVAGPERTPGLPGPNRLLSEVMGGEPPPPSPPGAGAFDWATHGLEVAHLLLSDARAGRSLAGPRREARSREAASDGLVAAAGASADPHLRALVARGPRAIMPVVQTPPGVLERGFTILARPRTGGFESAAPLTLETARVRLATEGVRTRLDVAEKVFRHRADCEGNAVDTALQDQVLSVGERVLTRFTQTGAPPPAFGMERVAFEALVSLTGRPALRVENKFLNLDAPELEYWRTAIEMGKPEIEQVLPSVGRIDMNGEHIGTGFIVTSGLIMTNRHVLEAIAAPIPTRLSPKRWTLLSNNTVIDFSPNPDVEQSSFRIKSVVFAGPDPIDDVVDFAHLDLALLEVETTNATGETLPPALSLSKSDKRALRSRNLYVVGYPAQPVVPLGSVNGTDRATIVEKLRQIFGLRYGRKYFSPGQVSIASGGDAQDAKGWVFAHDATTLGGNSGSCVLHFGDPMAVVGLHFAGNWMRANFAHTMAALQGVLGSAVPGDTPTTWI